MMSHLICGQRTKRRPLRFKENPRYIQQQHTLLLTSFSPMTSVACMVEDAGEMRCGVINKTQLVSLADIKAELNFTQQEGVYLAKTQDGVDSYHWSIIVNDQDIVPSLMDGSISIKIRPTLPGLLFY